MLNREGPWWERAKFERNPLGDVPPDQVLQNDWYVETPAAAAACASLQQALKDGRAAKIFIKGPSGGGKTLLMTRIIDILRDGGARVAVEKVHHGDSKNLTGPAVPKLVLEMRREVETRLGKLAGKLDTSDRRVLVIENLHKGAEAFQQLFLSDCQGILEDALSDGITLVIIGGKEVFLRSDAQSIGWYDEGSYSLENFTFDEAKEFLERRLSSSGRTIDEYIDDPAIAVLLQTNAIPREFKKNANDLLTKHFQPGQPLTKALAASIALKADDNMIEQARLKLREQVGTKALHVGIEDLVHRIVGLSIGDAAAHQMVGAVLDDACERRARGEATPIEAVAKTVASEPIWALDEGTINQFVQAFADDVEFCATVGPDGTSRGSPKAYALMRQASDQLLAARSCLQGEPLRYHLSQMLDKTVKPKPSEIVWGRIEGILRSRRDACDSLAKARLTDFLSEPKALGKRLPDRTALLVACSM